MLHITNILFEITLLLKIYTKSENTSNVTVTITIAKSDVFVPITIKP